MKSRILTCVCVATLAGSVSWAACAALPAALAEPLQACTGCHGEDGNGAKRSYPFLNWQLPQYLEDQIVGYQNGTQPTNVPKHIPKTISSEQIKGIASFYGKQTPAREKPIHDAAKATAGKAVYEERCIECHLDGGREFKLDGPTLAGQPAEYLFMQEKWYASGKRKYSAKADVAHKGMADADREAVSHFFASQDIKPADSSGKRRRR